MLDRTLAALALGTTVLCCAVSVKTAAEAPESMIVGSSPVTTTDTEPERETVGELEQGGSSELRDVDELDWRNTKSWQVRATAEFHHLVRQNDLASDSTGRGDASNRNLFFYVFSAQYEPTPYDRLVAQWGFYQRFLADGGETGVRSDDGLIAYTRTIPLPGRVILRVQPRVDFGLSYDSIEHTGLIAAPRLGVSLERRFGPVDLYALVYGYVFLERYTSAIGGSPNPMTSLATLVEATYRVPPLPSLEAGVAGYASATWFHEVQDDGSNALIAEEHSTSDPLTASQPFSNTFGGEVFVRYTLPTRAFASQVLVAYANGDPTIGYQALRHDGVGRFNLFYRHVSELYAALTLRY